MKGSPAPTPEVYGTVQRSGDHYAAPLLLVQRFPWGRGFESRSVQKLERRLQSSKVATLKWYSHITPAARITVLGSIHYTATHVEGTPAPTHLWGVLWRELLPWPTWGELCGGNSCPDPLGGSYVEGTPAPTHLEGVMWRELLPRPQKNTALLQRSGQDLCSCYIGSPAAVGSIPGRCWSWRHAYSPPN